MDRLQVLAKIFHGTGGELAVSLGAVQTQSVYLEMSLFVRFLLISIATLIISLSFSGCRRCDFSTLRVTRSLVVGLGNTWPGFVERWNRNLLVAHTAVQIFLVANRQFSGQRIVGQLSTTSWASTTTKNTGSDLPNWLG